MSSPFTALLSSLGRHRGVTACMVVGASDGLIVDASLRTGMNGEAFAALSASLYRKAQRAARAAGFGETGFFELDADGGHMCAAGRDDIVLVVVSESRLNVGLLRVEMLRSLEAIA
jgi:uncharacterized protein